MVDPDGDLTLEILQSHLASLPLASPPELDKWTDDLNCMPEKLSYLTIVEWLVKREVCSASFSLFFGNKCHIFVNSSVVLFR